MSDSELSEAMDLIGTTLRDAGKNSDQVEELLHAEAVRVAEELRNQEEA